MSNETSQPSASAALQQDVRCTVCGYNLRGLGVGGSCPECGRAISDSCQGDLLRYADPNWVMRMYRGALLVSAAFGLFFAYLIVGGMAFAAVQLAGFQIDAWLKVGPYLLRVVLTASVVIALLGVFLITSQEPREYLLERTTAIRRLARGAILLGVLIFVFKYHVAPNFYSVLMGVFLNLAFVVSLALSLKHAQLVAKRIPDERLAMLLGRWSRRLLVIGLCFSAALMLLFAARITPRPWWANAAYEATTVIGLAYVIVAIVSVGLFLAVAAALKSAAST